MGIRNWFHKKPKRETEDGVRVSREQRLVDEYKNAKNYASLAHFITTGDNYGLGLEYFSARDDAVSALVKAGSDAVGAVIEELRAACDAWRAGKGELAEVLCLIRDPKAVPILKETLDEGQFSASSTVEERIREFIGHWPDLQPEPRSATCLLCELTFPIDKTESYGDEQGREWRLCHRCWRDRAEWLYKIQEKNPTPFRRWHG